MLREILGEFDFDLIELGHGIRISLMPGVQKMFEAGKVRFSSLHNFCPLPVEVMGASPDCYTFSSRSGAERQRAVKQTLQTIDFAARLGRAFRRAASRQRADQAGDGAADRARQSGRDVFPRICATKGGSGRETRSGRARLSREREGMPQADHRTRGREKRPARNRRPARLRGNPERARNPAASRRAQLAAGRLLARHRAHPDQGEPRFCRSRGMAARDRTTNVRLSCPGLHLAGAGSSAAFCGRRRSSRPSFRSSRRNASLFGK